MLRCALFPGGQTVQTTNVVTNFETKLTWRLFQEEFLSFRYKWWYHKEVSWWWILFSRLLWNLWFCVLEVQGLAEGHLNLSNTGPQVRGPAAWRTLSFGQMASVQRRFPVVDKCSQSYRSEAMWWEQPLCRLDVLAIVQWVHRWNFAPAEFDWDDAMFSRTRASCKHPHRRKVRGRNTHLPSSTSPSKHDHVYLCVVCSCVRVSWFMSGDMVVRWLAKREPATRRSWRIWGSSWPKAAEVNRWL